MPMMLVTTRILTSFVKTGPCCWAGDAEDEQQWRQTDSHHHDSSSSSSRGVQCW